MDAQSAASGRLASLQRHLAAAAVRDEPDGGAVQQPTRAEDQDGRRPAPGGGAGSLTVIDNRTGKRYEIAISAGGTIRAADLKRITAGGDGVGLRTYDPGYVNTAACISKISFIDGDKGILRYRGYPIEQLAERSTFTEVSYLLQYGELPGRGELRRWDEALRRHSALPVFVENAVAALPHDAHFMGIILTALNALSTGHPEQNPALAGQGIYASREVQDKQIVRLLGKMPAIAALAYHRASGRAPAQPNQALGFSENFLYMLDAGATRDYRPNPRLAHAIDVMFTLHAEHEMNCSTAAARHLASSGVDVYTAVAGAVGALYGPLHGGANEAVLRMLERIGSVDAIPAFLQRVKNRQEKMFGFGHRVYKNFDPRAAVIRRVAEEVFEIQGRDPLIDVALALMEAARQDEYFVKRRLYPNVDYFSGLVYKAMGFPTQYFTVLFAVPRVAGYLAHWRESLGDPDAKIVRPQQDYQGVWLREYVPLEQRLAQPDSKLDTLSAVPPSNAYRRRAAGSLAPPRTGS